MSTWAKIKHFVSSLARDAWERIRGWHWSKKVIVPTLLVAAVLFVLFFDVPPLSTLRSWADAAGGWFPVAVWLAYVLITQFPIPRTLLTLTCGILFGPWQGVLMALSATTVSAAVSLIVVRWLLGDWIRPYLTHPAVAGINEHLERRGWAAVLSLRMIAGVPFSIMNYTAALTSIRVVPFTIATLIGSAPGTIAVVFFGDTLTGEADPRIVVITIALAVLGVIGLLIDARIPVKPKN